MLSLKSQFSVTDAAENAAELDETLWSKIISSVGALDVLPAGIPRSEFRMDGAQIRRILDFGQRNYDAVCVDLSGMMEKYSVEVLRHATQIFLVCTPEVACLHLAGVRLQILRRLELEERVSVLVNRAEKNHWAISISDVEGILKRKVVLALPNAYDT